MAVKKTGLGRGLGALLYDTEEEYQNDKEVYLDKDAPKEKSELDIDLVKPNPDQPRKSFNEEALEALCQSIIKHGIITPIVVSPKDGKYIIIAGERRYRAAMKAGLKKIPVFIRESTKKEIDELSLIENIQREDLNPIETAVAIKKLMNEYNYTQSDVADRIAKSRSDVANIVRLLTLTQPVKDLVAQGTLSAGHARCLVIVEDSETQLNLALKGQSMTVRDFEKLVKSVMYPEKKQAASVQSIELKDLLTRMQRIFSTKISALGNDNKGRIYLDYFTRDDLDRIEAIIEYLESNYVKKDEQPLEE